MRWHIVKKCVVVWWVPIIQIVFETMDIVSSELGIIQIVTNTRFKSNHLWLYEGVSAHGIANMHVCKGNINAEKYILEQQPLPSR